MRITGRIEEGEGDLDREREKGSNVEEGRMRIRGRIGTGEGSIDREILKEGKRGGEREGESEEEEEEEERNIKGLNLPVVSSWYLVVPSY